MKVGDAMPGGTILAGFYEGKPLYTTPKDEPLTVTFKGAATQAGALNMTNAFDHHDWRVPTKGELNVLFDNRAAIGGFNETGSHPGGWYRSSTLKSNSLAWVQRFSDGDQYSSDKSNDSSRSEERRVGKEC
jgi:hypothetical protein